MSFLQLQNISKIYESQPVLESINISIEKGEFLVLVGPSGCGKSTLLNMIAGLEDVTQGAIHIDEKDVTHVAPSERDIAMVFQSYALYPSMSVRENITFGLEMRGVPKDERNQQCDQVAEILQIGHLLDRKPSALSGGQRQRVAMGRALVRNPLVFLFDEPLSNLDAKLRVDMRTEIKLLHQRLKTTVVYVTHDQIEAMTLATRIAVMNGGVIQQLGRPEEIYYHPQNLFVASFMGSPSMNLIEIEAADVNGQICFEIETSNGDTHAVALDGYQCTGGKYVIGVRPEDLTDIETSDQRQTNTLRLSSPVDVVEPAGSDTFVVIQVCGQSVTCRVRGDSKIQEGGEAEFLLNLDRIHLFDQHSGERLKRVVS